ncbi:hypothetical protein F4777DRAFT_595347 [Nemania sp. FL0916]|nr:hypothetical protein F4777DRAFT_595347 [Nemania sp. FL0916]
MASRQVVPAFPARQAAPAWSQGAMSEAALTGGAVRLSDLEPMEFILSSNWVLKEAGIKDFYDILYKCGQNLEIQYDPELLSFRVNCLARDEVNVVSIMKETLDIMVQKEIENGLETSPNIESLQNWRENVHAPGEEVQVSPAYAFPRDIALCDNQDTWSMPEALLAKGIKLEQTIPKSALSKIQQLTETVLLASSNQCQVYIGASDIGQITEAKRKLDTLARFFDLIPRDTREIIHIFLHNEEDRSTKGEFRYLADGNERLLKSHILDQLEWSHMSSHRRYPIIFSQGVFVRLNPAREPWNEASSVSNMAQPNAQNQGGGSEFAAFMEWKYPPKAEVLRSNPSGVYALDIRSTPNLINPQSMIRPNIESWVSGIPHPGRSTQSGSKKSSNAPTSEDDLGYVTADEYPTTDDCIVSRAPQEGTTVQSEVVTTIAADAQPPSSDLTMAGTHQTSVSVLDNSDAATRSEITSPDNATENLTVEEPQEISGLTCRMPQRPLSSKDYDPFEHLWRERKALNTPKLASEPKDHQNEKSGDSSKNRQFHNTMKQKAGRRTRPDQFFPDFAPNMMPTINKALMQLLTPLRIHPGFIDLSIELGKFHFMKVEKSTIQNVSEDDDEKHYTLEVIQKRLNQRHRSKEDLRFTRVLTCLGRDANFIAHLNDSAGKPMWDRPHDGRSSTYEFGCRATTADGTIWHFIVEIDATSFSAKVKQLGGDRSCFPVQCTKRVWDFQIVLSVTQDLNDICGQFADDLVSSLQVKPTNDGIPELKVSYDRSYNIEVIVVRTRNTACCTRQEKNKDASSAQSGPVLHTQRLYISEIWEMARLSIVASERRMQLSFARYTGSAEGLGFPLVWYEAVLKPDTISTAFQQNEKLELGEEAKWTPEELLETGALEALVQTAGNMVKQMDGVGYWNDNHQDELLRDAVPVVKPGRDGYVEKYW